MRPLIAHITCGNGSPGSEFWVFSPALSGRTHTWLPAEVRFFLSWGGDSGLPLHADICLWLVLSPTFRWKVDILDIIIVVGSITNWGLFLSAVHSLLLAVALQSAVAAAGCSSVFFLQSIAAHRLFLAVNLALGVLLTAIAVLWFVWLSLSRMSYYVTAHLLLPWCLRHIDSFWLTLAAYSIVWQPICCRRDASGIWLHWCLMVVDTLLLCCFFVNLFDVSMARRIRYSVDAWSLACFCSISLHYCTMTCQDRYLSAPWSSLLLDKQCL